MNCLLRSSKGNALSAQTIFAKISTGSATLADYRKSGFDRGHFAPAADMAFSQVAMSESFYLSNISARRLIVGSGEQQVRLWVKRHRRLIIVTGGIVENAEFMGEVAVPAHFCKIIYDPKRQKMLAFVLENRGYK